MQPGTISLIAFIVALTVGILAKVNIGLVSLAVAFVAGRFLLGMSARAIVEGWPMRLFFVLFGMSLLFGVLSANGTLHLMVRRSVQMVRGRTRLLPLMLLFVSIALSALGAGAIAVTAIMMPPALALAREEKIPLLLVSLMVILGACAGGLSPIAPTGIIANDLARADDMEVAFTMFRDIFLAKTLLALGLYFVLGGWRIPSRSVHKESAAPAFHRSQRMTLAVTAVVVVAIMFGSDIALTAFLGTTVLLLLRTARESEILARVPWSAILLVCGVATLVSVVEKTEGIHLLTRLLAGFMNAATAGPIFSVLAGLMSQVSSASGVVLPTLIPTVRGISAELRGVVQPEALVSVIAIGSHLATVSPFSTLGALAIASAGDSHEKDVLFRKLIILAFASLAVGAGIGFVVVWGYA